MGVQRTFRIIISLLLVILFLSACLLSSIFVFMGAWLHTYNAFTDKTLVAEVTVSQLQQDDSGQYMDVTYTPIAQESALVSLFTTSAKSTNTQEPQNFKIYGDTIHIGGPIVKFYDHLILLNFKTIYKVGKLYGRYNLDNELEINRKVPASFDLNGGIDSTWQTINENIDKWPYNMFFHTTEISAPGVFATRSGGNRTYKLFITNTGFLWELQ